jgi:hypothetical protein
MTPDKAKQGFFISVTCPACGSALGIESDLLTTTCESCGSVLRLVIPNVPPAYLIRAKITEKDARFHVDRFLKENHQPLTDSEISVSKIYYPYWKIDAILLRLRHRNEKRVIFSEATETESCLEQQKVETTLTPYDVTVGAGSLPDIFPWSLGERPEYTPTVPFAEGKLQEGYRVLPSVTAWPDALATAQKASQQINKIDGGEFGANLTKVLRPVLSQIYFPYLLCVIGWNRQGESFLLDGLSGRVVYHYARDLRESLRAPGPKQHDEIVSVGVALHRCGNCGAQLPDGKSYIYVCRNCHHIEALEYNAILKREVQVVRAPDKPSDRLFPFWKLNSSSEAFLEYKHGFAGSASGALVVPAFRTGNFEGMYRLAKRITTAFDKFSLDDLCDLQGDFLPANVSCAEAMALAQVILTRDVIGKGKRLPAEGLDLKFGEISLFYAPFHPESYFYVDSCLSALTFERSLADRPGPTSLKSDAVPAHK